MSFHELLAPELAPDEIQSACNATLCTMDHAIRSGGPPQSTYFSGVQFGSVDVFMYKGMGERIGYRGHHHIREDQQDNFLCLVSLNATIQFSQSNTVTRVGPGAFVLLSTARPFVSSLTSSNQGEASSILEVKVSGSLLRQRIPTIDDYCEREIGIRPGTGHIMHSMFELALIDGRSLSEDQALKYSSMMVDVMAEATISAPELADLRGNPLIAPHKRVVDLAKSVIDRNLSNSALDAEFIAEVCQVSVRYLRSIFSSFGCTIGSYIREARLQQCKAAFRNPMLRHRTIIQIAMQWGFNEPAYFSRAYKTRFGKTPKEERGQRVS